ncbi:MAG: dTDP-glucose 4,6-dehydratase [Acidimicrobiaceae bacterium]|nr:dTDP-glucose 4,6-dehydratase [Acidimicrobiaceae bacterium]
MRLFITGAAGFIGSNYLRHVLATTDHSAVAFDALTYAGNLDSIKDVLGDRALFVHGDVTDRSAVRSAMSGCGRVVHFAAESHVDRSISGPDAFVHTNCLGTSVLCDVAREVGVERFVHVSTDEVYGSVEAGSSRETDAVAPRSLYAASKAGSDHIALSYFSTHGLPVIVTRASNNYGPFQFPEKVIPLFATNLLDGGRVPLYGDGLNIRDWLHVDDHCVAIDTILSKGDDGEIYNVGAGNEITNRDLTGRLVELCGRDESAIEYVPDRPGHDRRYSLDCTKLRTLGWAPRQDLIAGLERTVEWYRTNRNWWEALKSRVAVRP